MKDFNLKQFQAVQAGRLLSEYRDRYLLGDVQGHTFYAEKQVHAPAYYVGDVVAWRQEGEQFFITELLQRERVVKKATNQTGKSFHTDYAEQIMASNVDQIFIVMASNQRLTLSKLERYILVFSQEDIAMHIVITKADLNTQCEAFKQEIQMLYPHVHVHLTSIYQLATINQLLRVCQPGQVGLFLGSSGAGKSTLINYVLSGETVKVGQVCQDGKGRHTTTTSQFLYSETLDYYVIDTPGFRGIDTHDAVDESVLYDDVLSLAEQCKFSDCKHQGEPDCAIKAAIAQGTLTQEKFDRYVYNQEKIRKRDAFEKKQARQKMRKGKPKK